MLTRILEEGEVPEYEAVKALAAPQEPAACPVVTVREPDLSAYDRLLEPEAVSA